MKNNLKSVIVLTVICLVVATILAIINLFTADIIKKNEDKIAFEACYDLISDAEGFENVDLTKYDLPKMITNVYKETSNKGYVFKMNTSGYNSGLVIMCAIDMEGKIINTKIVQSEESPGYGKRFEDIEDAEAMAYLDSYIGKDSSLTGVTSVSHATMTSNGYKGAIQAAFSAYFAITGGNSNE